MTARTVYVVTSGEYSDYRVDSVFETRPAAEAWAGKWGQVEEFPMFADGDNPEDYERTVVQADVIVDTNGKILEGPPFGTYANTVYAADYEAAERQYSDQIPRVVRLQHAFVRGQRLETCWRVNAFAPTKEAAEKAVRERAAKVASLVVQGMDPTQMEG